MNNILRRRSMGGEKRQYSIHDYMTISALEDGLTASLSTNACEYCIDGSMEWIELPADTSTLAINKGQTLSFRATGLKPAYSVGIGTFTISGKCNLLGNCMAMLYGDDAYKQTLLDEYYAFCKLFYNCDKIISVSENFLPANLKRADYCYKQMFYGCKGLCKGPELPSTTVTWQCYDSMFYNCTSLIVAPELPATTLAKYCYHYMFRGCSSLVNAPELPATTLAIHCYQYMFDSCTSLTTAPKLHAMTLANSCYYGMFANCENLNTDIELPATTLAEECYERMFADCKNLINPPKVLAEVLSRRCCYSMFENCTSLIKSPTLYATELAASCYGRMFWGANVLPDCSNIDFTNEAVIASGGLRELFSKTKVTDKDLFDILPINDNGEYWLPVMTMADSCYNSMFSFCADLITAPKLPATTLANYCYDSMFWNCTNLTTAPELPAVVLTHSCYQNMFLNCKNLVNAPELSAAALIDNCYSRIFDGCSKLNYIKMLATDISATNCMFWWTKNVSSKGTFIKHPDMNSLPEGVNGIPSGWTVINNV